MRTGFLCGKINNPMRLILLVACITWSLVAEALPQRELQVIDGDTVKFQVNFLPPELGSQLSLRINGIDTPEKGHRAQCIEESVRAISAASFLTDAINSASTYEIKMLGWDKFGGRVVGDLFLDGRNVAEMLLNVGLAKPYDGKKKPSWCEQY